MGWFFRKIYHALLDIVENLQNNMDLQYFSCGIFIDLKMAFDTVNHKILFDKLNFHGFQGIINEWFQSYSTNRMQTTQIVLVVSTKLTSPCGGR